MFRSFEEIAVGETRALTRKIGEADVRRFVELSGDDNPLHVDRRYAETTSFKDIVVHGMLGASFVSTLIGTQLPGPGALWVSQRFEFLLPVRLGDELTITGTVAKKHERDRLLELEVTIVNQSRQVVLRGDGLVKVLEPPAPAPAEDPSARPRVAIVTGGGGGIGRAIAVALARAGHPVVVNHHGRADRAEAVVAEITAAEGRAVAVRADVGTEDGVATLLRAAGALGEVGVLVNNASPPIGARPLADLAWADVQHHLDVQVKGALLLAQACAPAMIARRWGRIVNITSQVTHGPPTVGWTGYAVAKGALATLSRYLAAELGPHGVTVNCVAPGMTETAMIGDIPAKAQLMVGRQTPLRRLARPEDVANTVAWLASDGAAFITGETVDVNGGMVMR